MKREIHIDLHKGNTKVHEKKKKALVHYYLKTIVHITNKYTYTFQKLETENAKFVLCNY